MPTSIVLAAVAGFASGSTIAAGIGFSWFAFGGSLVMSALSRALAKKPDDPATTATFTQQGRNVTLQQAISPRRVIYGQDRVGGVVTYKEVATVGGIRNSAYFLVLTLAGHSCEQLGDIYFGDELVPLDELGNATGRFAGFVHIEKILGGEDGQPFPPLVTYSAGLWTDAHRQTGCAKIFVWLTFNPNIFPSGIPNITCIVKGKNDVYDPRTGLRGYTENPALCIADYLCDSRIGFGANYAAEIHEGALIAGANVCEESVPLSDGGNEPRYRLSGTFQLSEKPKDIISRMLSAMAGKAVYIGGRWRILPGAYVAPTVTLDENDVVGSIKQQVLVSRRESANAVKGIYVEPANLYQAGDFPGVASDTYMAEDNGERVWKDIDLTAFVRSGTQAQRLAKIELLRGRQGLTVDYPCRISAYRVQPGDTVAISNVKYGWSAKPFEVSRGTFSVNTDGTLGYALNLRETAAAVFDWNTSEEQTVDIAPNTSLMDPFTMAPPGNPAIVEELYESRDGRGVAAKAIVTWGVSMDAFAVSYQPEYRFSGDTAWTVLPTQAGNSVEIFDIAPGRYDFRVKAINSLGVSSDYAQTLNKEIHGLSARPETPVIRGLQAAGGLAILTLDAHPALDVRRGGRWRIRHCEDSLAPTWEESFSIGEEKGYIADQTIIVLPLKAGSYLVKAEDSSKQQSENFAFITTKQASVLTYSPVDSLQEDPTFPGTHSSTVAVSSTLQLDSSGEFDDIVDFDAIASLDNIGGIEADGTYTFAAGFDFGSVRRVRIIGHIEGFADNVNDQFDDRTGLIDDWLDFDGPDGGGSVDAYLEFRETDDDPSGTPAWSEWKRLDAAEVECWGAEFRLRIKSYDPAYNMLVDTLRVVAEEVT